MTPWISYFNPYMQIGRCQHDFVFNDHKQQSTVVFPAKNFIEINNKLTLRSLKRLICLCECKQLEQTHHLQTNTKNATSDLTELSSVMNLRVRQLTRKKIESHDFALKLYLFLTHLRFLIETVHFVVDNCCLG